jgi:hypothetical protein
MYKHTNINEFLILGGTNSLDIEFIKTHDIGYNICCAEECRNELCNSDDHVKSKKIYIK